MDSSSLDTGIATADFSFLSILSGEYTTVKNILWKDEWFFEPTTVYNHKLATAAMGLSALAYADGERNIAGYEQLGFTSDDVCTEVVKDPKGPIGFTLACKRIKKQQDEKSLIVIAVRGTIGRAEWESNMDISGGSPTVDVHVGFEAAKNIILGKLQAFLTNKGLEEEAPSSKVLLVGHSRGAAVANLLALELVSSGAYALEDTYCYTFATPNVATHLDPAPYIFNIINPDDFVPRAPLEKWNFGKHGVSYELPSTSNFDKDEFMKRYEAMNLFFKDMTGNNFQYYEKGVAPVEGFIRSTADYAPSLLEYYTEQYGLGKITMYELFMVLATIMDNGVSLKEEITFGYDTLVDFPEILPFFFGEIGPRHLVFHNHCQEGYLAWLQSQDDLS